MKGYSRHVANGSISSQGPADVKATIDAFEGIEGMMPADGKRPTGPNAAKYNNNRRPEIMVGHGYPLAEPKELTGALKAFQGPWSADGRWPIDPNDAEYLIAVSRFSYAYDYFVHREYNLAAKGWIDIMRFLLGSDHPLPGNDNRNEYGVECPTYSSISVHRCFLLMKCCYQLAKCSLNSGEGKSRQYADSSSHVWVQPTSPTIVDLAFTDCLMGKAHIFDAIGNSSAYQHSVTLMGRFLLTLPPWRKYAGRNDSAWVMAAAYNNYHKNQYNGPILTQRHPDPQSERRYQIIDPNLQVRGAWRKEYLEKEERLLPRTYRESVFIWGGYLYAVQAKLGQGVGTSPGIPEVRRISLNERTKWEHVTTFPAVRGEGFMNDVCIDGNNMYAFSGHPKMDILNLSTNKWTTVKTTWKPTATDRRLGLDPIWPWYRRAVAGAALHIVGGWLYVFGGLNGFTFTGCNLFMGLNLKTLKWRRLSGTPFIREHDPRVPGPRMNCGSWVSPDRRGLYVFSGVCLKARKGVLGDKNGPSESWMYNDLWSWDIASETWREVRMQGNHPSPRTGMGFVFSKKLNAALIFGGSNGFVRTKVGDSPKSELHPGFYADTYMWSSPSPSKSNSESEGDPGHWKQIQTIGFPTYRMACHLIIDPDTEDIYLYGGEVAGDSIPSKAHTEEQRSKRKTHESPVAAQMARSPAIAELAREMEAEDLGATSYTVKFGDLWKLHVNAPGGDFGAINMEDELRTATLGPWHRCFECRRVGFWKKCGGSCSGKAFFCGTECQSKGWKVHKKLNGCRKLA